MVISSKAEAYGLERARQYGFDAVAVPRQAYQEVGAFNAEINTVLARYPIDLMAVAHKILVIIYHVLMDGTFYEESRYDRHNTREEEWDKILALAHAFHSGLHLR